MLRAQGPAGPASSTATAAAATIVVAAAAAADIMMAHAVPAALLSWCCPEIAAFKVAGVTTGLFFFFLHTSVMTHLLHSRACIE